MDQINDPHGRILTILGVLRAHQEGISLNKLSKETGIHKETLDPFLEFLSDQGLIILDKSSQLKWKIRLGEIVEAENTVLNLVKGHFESYLALLPKSTKVVQVESVVHFLHVLSLMQMFVYLNYLNNKSSFDISQTTIKNYLDVLKNSVIESSSKLSAKKHLEYGKRINQEVGLVSEFLAEKAVAAFGIVMTRTKHRGLEEILFDTDLVLPHRRFIDKLMAQVNKGIKNKELSKKQLDSLPIKFEHNETEFFKKMYKIQSILDEKQTEHFLDFGEEKIGEHFLGMSDVDINTLQRNLEERNIVHGLTPTEIKKFIADLKTVRKEYKEEKANSRKKPPKAASTKNS